MGAVSSEHFGFSFVRSLLVTGLPGFSRKVMLESVLERVPGKKTGWLGLWDMTQLLVATTSTSDTVRDLTIL